MSQGVAYPEHPDNYGSHRLGMERERDDVLWDEGQQLAPEVTDEEAEAMWAREQSERALIAIPHEHRDGHMCSSGGCYGRTAAERSHQCMTCVLDERDHR